MNFIAKRKLFCEISPLCYEISVWKGRLLRYASDLFSWKSFARRKSQSKLPVVIERHKSLILRKLGNVDAQLQDNKAINLSLAAPKINGVLIRPGEIFSFWKLVGLTSERRGYKIGLMIRHGKPDQGIGGGLCQMSNLIHWLVLHSPLTIVEHHHHDKWDLFPDFGRQVPFGLGTSISHNYLDYRFQNNTDQTYQLLLWCDNTYLNGELRAEQPLEKKYHIRCLTEYFAKENGIWYRHNRIQRIRIHKATGIPDCGGVEIIKVSHAQVLYDESFIPKEKIQSNPGENAAENRSV